MTDVSKVVDNLYADWLRTYGSVGDPGALTVLLVTERETLASRQAAGDAARSELARRKVEYLEAKLSVEEGEDG